MLAELAVTLPPVVERREADLQPEHQHPEGDHEPTKASKTRIKRLRGLSRPQYRLRVGDDVRVFYDVIEEIVAL